MDIRTTSQWEQQYKGESFRDGGKDFYRQAESEAIWVGKWYMSGETNIEEVKQWLFSTGCIWPFRLSTSLDLLRKGVKYAIEEGIAIESRIQPAQDEQAFYSEIKQAKRVQKNIEKFLNKVRR